MTLLECVLSSCSLARFWTSPTLIILLADDALPSEATLSWSSLSADPICELPRREPSVIVPLRPGQTNVEFAGELPLLVGAELFVVFSPGSEP